MIESKTGQQNLTCNSELDPSALQVIIETTGKLEWDLRISWYYCITVKLRILMDVLWLHGRMSPFVGNAH